MIMIPAPVHPCEGKATSSDADTVSTSEESPDSIEKRLSSCSLSSSDRDARDSHLPASTPATPPTPRRSIFNSYWQKGQSSSSLRDDCSDQGSPGPGRDTNSVKRTTQWEPSYLGVYSFAPSPLLSPKPPPVLPLSPISSTDSLLASPPVAAPAPLRPKSILRRHRSRSFSNKDGKEETPQSRVGRPRSATCVGPELSPRAHFDIAPPPLVQDDISTDSSRSRSSHNGRDREELRRQHSFVHFDPTITIRECVDEDLPQDDAGSNWFSENELRTFMAETVNLCHSSAVTAVKTYSLPAVKKQYETAHDAGIKSPVLSTTRSECRALYADPFLHAGGEDAIVHDGSKKFFRIMAKEMKNVLIVDSSPSTLKLFRRHVLSMFPHVRVDTASSGEDALDKIQVDPHSKCPGLNYDLIVVEERLHPQDSDPTDETRLLDLTGSELLRLLNEMEDSSSCQCSTGIKQAGCIKPQHRCSPRRSLKIGVSVSLGEDCEALKGKGGADFLWSKPPPKPSNGLRNQVLNALLSKRGKSVFVCGC